MPLVDQRNCEHDFQNRFRRCKHCDLPRETYELYVELRALQTQQPARSNPPPEPAAAALSAPAPQPVVAKVPPPASTPLSPPTPRPPQPASPAETTITPPPKRPAGLFGMERARAKGMTLLFVCCQDSVDGRLCALDKSLRWTHELRQAHGFPPTYAKSMANALGGYTTDQHPKYHQQTSRDEDHG